MRSIKVGETTYLAADAEAASKLLDIETEEFWAGLTRGELDELGKLAHKLNPMPTWCVGLEAKTMSFSPRSWPNLQQVGRAATAAQSTPQTGAIPIYDGYGPLDPDDD